MLELGAPLPTFELQDVVTGRTVASSELAGKPLLVAVICNHCPYVKHIKTGLVELGHHCRDKGVEMVAVSANDPAKYPEDAPQAMAEEAQRFGYGFSYLFDETQSFVRKLRAACTPEFYLFDGTHRLAYRGQMDDSRPNNDVPVTGADVKAAIDCVCAGKAPSADQKPSVGCSIKWKPGNEPDFVR